MLHTDMQNIADCACADHLTRLTDERIASVRIRYAEQQTALLRNAGKLLGFLGAERKRLVAYNVDAMLEKALCNLVMRIVCRHDGDKINTVLTRGLLICQARRRSYQISASEVCDAIIASAMQQAAKPSLLPGPAVGSMPRRWLIQCHNMTFICADLRTYQPPKNVTAVISLHACDIATDLALGTAIRAKAKYIACVPCCHKELLDQYTMPGLEPLTKFGVFKARFNDVLTDSMRALKLEAEGYKVSVVEYISPLDTPKNLLIRATRTGKVNHRAKAEYDAVRRTLGTTSELDRRCAELDNEFFVTDEDLMG